MKVGPQTRASLRKHLESKRPTGGTNLYDGLELALNHVARDEKPVARSA